MFTLTDTTVKIQLVNYDVQSSIQLIALCRERGIAVIESQSKFQNVAKQTNLVTSTRPSNAQFKEASPPHHNNNGGDETSFQVPNIPLIDIPSVIPQVTFIEILTVSASPSTIAQTVHEFYQEFNKKDSTITINRDGQTLNLNGKKIETIEAFLNKPYPR